jgi:hypothetical protein
MSGDVRTRNDGGVDSRGGGSSSGGVKVARHAPHGLISSSGARKEGVRREPSFDIDDFHHEIIVAEKYLHSTKAIGKTGPTSTGTDLGGTVGELPGSSGELTFTRRSISSTWESHDTAAGNDDVVDDDSLGESNYVEQSQNVSRDDNESNSGILFFASDIPQAHGISTPMSTPRSLNSTADSVTFSRYRTDNLTAADDLNRHETRGQGRSKQRPASAGAAVRTSHKFTESAQLPSRASNTRANTPQGTHLHRSSMDKLSAPKKSPEQPQSGRVAPKRSKDQILSYVNNMTAIHEKKLQQREKQKAEIEKLELVQCTFKPTISRGAEAILRSKQELANEQVELLSGPKFGANASTAYRYRSYADELKDYVEEDVVERLSRKAKEQEELNKIAQKV